MPPSPRKRHQTAISYDLDPYKNLESEPEALENAPSASDEEFTLPDSTKGDGSYGGNFSDEEQELMGESESDDEEGDYEQLEGGSNDGAHDGSVAVGEPELYIENEPGNATEQGSELGTPWRRRQQRQPGQSHPTTRINHRVGVSTKSTSKRERVQIVYGNEPDVLVKAMEARDLWIADPALPSRKNIQRTPFYDEEKLGEYEELDYSGQKVTWLQYSLEGGNNVESYLPDQSKKLKCVLGPLTSQKIITFARFGIHDLGASFQVRNGYLINSGGSVSGLGWAPERDEGRLPMFWLNFNIYLAISTKSPELPLQPNAEIPRAYVQTSGPGNIQIWRVPSNKDGGIAAKPALILVLCHEWGVAKDLNWCPMKRKIQRKQEIGLLTAVFSDGAVRVLRVCLPEDDPEEETFFVKIEVPLFEANIKDTLCTCVAWLNPHEIVAGCANGFIAAWNIYYATKLGRAADMPPHVYIPTHQTYILDVDTCWPSFPHFVVTTSMDGHACLTSLHDPEADRVFTGRSRLPSYSIAWNDYVHSAIASEEGAWVKMYGARRFFSATSIAKQPSSGVSMTLGSSINHPCILSGGAEGEVVICNPLRRVFHGKIPVYQQTWFQIEYSAKSDMYRILEGFKMEVISFKHEAKGTNDQNLTMIFEEKGYITRVCWNPNPKYGGWAAAGTASGLVRIEDIAV